VIVGVPGTGIGGIFYLVAALLLPAVAFARRLAGHQVRWRQVLGQFVLALGILGGIWVTWWLLGLALRPLARRAAGAAGPAAAAFHQSVARGEALLATVATLSAVLVAVQIARLVVRYFGSRSR
jgi:hypothetical protein